MVRSKWIKTVMASVVSTGLALGQEAAPPTPAKDDPTGRVITVNEAGKPPQKCKIVKHWTDAKGQRVLQVEVVGSGDVMTIVETGVAVAAEPSAPRTMQTKIFHWGKDRRPHPEAPLAPEVATVVPTQTPAPPKVVAAPPPASVPAAPSPVVKTSAPASTPASPPIAKPTPTPTLTLTPTPAPAPTYPKAVPIQSASPSVTPMPTTVVESAPRETLMSRIWSRDSKTPTTTTTTTPTIKGPVVVESSRTLPPLDPTPASRKMTAPVKKDSDTVRIETANPSDWRASWGKTEGTKGSESLKTTAGRGDDRKADPLADPGRYSRLPDDLKAAPRIEVPKKSDLPKVEGPTPISDVQQMRGGDKAALGARSVVDSGVPTQYPPVPFATMPMGGRPPQPTWTPPQPPRITPQRVNAPALDGGTLAANAFTPDEDRPPAPWTPMASMTSNAFSNGFGIRPNYGYGGGPAPGVFGPPRAPNPAMPSYPTMPYPAMPPYVGGAGPQAMALPAQPFGPQLQVAMAPAKPMTPVASATSPSGIAQVGYQTPMPVAATPASAADAAGHVKQLREALYPSQREAAADKLTAYDWRTHETVVAALLQAAREDPASTVRAACVDALVKLKVETLPVVMAMQALKTDTDARVRHRAEEALKVLAPSVKLK